MNAEMSAELNSFRYVLARYVINGAITEHFLGFTDMHKLDAAALTDSIISVLTKQGIDVKQCIAQCYDGASVMSGKPLTVRCASKI